tara:strand:- start:7991 stop:8326 length:336 start_codon:yes stop_codon:yes gene_type:complete
MKIEITKSEATILQAIAQNEMNQANYGIPTNIVETATWTNSLEDCELLEGMEMPSGRSISGIVSSLVQKGLVHSYADGRDSTIQHSELGFQVWIDQVYGRDEWEKAISVYA